MKGFFEPFSPGSCHRAQWDFKRVHTPFLSPASINSITKINKLLEVQERGRFPSQTLPNPKGIHEVGSSNNSGMDEVKAIITLRSGK